MECNGYEKREDLLRLAQIHWNAMAEFRRERLRCKRYTYGRQWEDTISTESGVMREEDYIRMQGNIPLKNNLIRRIVRNVLGVFRNQFTPPSIEDLDLPDSMRASMVENLNKGARANMLEELYSRTMEEFLISGLAVHRKWRGERNGVSGVWTEYVQPDYFIIDTNMRDFRGWDASMAGEIHDVSFDELCCKLAETPEDVDCLREIYIEGESDILLELDESFGSSSETLNFLSPGRAGRCRVFEIWKREHRGFYRCHDTLTGELFKIEQSEIEEIEKENQRRRDEAAKLGIDSRNVHEIRTRWLMEECWRYYFISPRGDLLRSGDSPYPGGKHPYVFKAYPFIDGEIHSFVSDLIDQQRYVNRLVTLYDWVMRASAKGVLLFPEGSLPDGVEIDDVSGEWSRFNGVIVYKPRPGVPLPQQISGNAANIGITELLQVQLKMMEDVSGVNGALQGKLESGAVSGTLYDQQTRHALTGLLDILQSFGSFIREGVRLEAALLC